MEARSEKMLKVVRGALSVVWYLLIILLFGLSVYWIVENRRKGHVSFDVPFDYYLTEVVSSERFANENILSVKIYDNQARIKLDIKESFVSYALFFFNLLVEAFFVLMILWQLRKIFNSINLQEPFIYDNVKRIKKIALLFILYYPVEWLLKGINHLIILKYVHLSSSVLSFSIDFTLILVGLMLYVIADVFKYGYELQQENKEFV
ncbi:hypothetical protein M2480_000336 [Parabacteroides sp. PFB2-12]|uniref:DUF2975 domain-containing protein n=1 Tax=unclassified Parabacteroides TaxID=2649774 RepID=UPI00247627E2|nr:MULTISPECIES: DUF2975 domain-containing protein [unclassified Parabacteroides]MDH6341186.1 hypothetical protein [Parabacteroides sp. PM6-13]MDH6389376.1 hypothetical protein [Parabacteroides sp. PFB2-12]